MWHRIRSPAGPFSVASLHASFYTVLLYRRRTIHNRHPHHISTLYHPQYVTHKSPSIIYLPTGCNQRYVVHIMSPTLWYPQCTIHVIFCPRYVVHIMFSTSYLHYISPPRVDLAAKRLAAADNNNANSADASASLVRRGIDPVRQCTSLRGRRGCLLTWPGRIHFGLFAYDLLHVLYNGCCGYFLDTVLDTMPASAKRILDTRARSFGSYRKASGLSTGRVRKLSSTGYLSAEMLVLHLFVLSHALGSRALLLKPAIRHDALVALSSLQIICYSVRGGKSYTEAEHRYIFAKIGTRFWRALSNIAHLQRRTKIADAESYNVDKPASKRRRVPHWRQSTILADESSDTASSSDDDMPPYFIRSEKILPHSFVHFAQQVMMGGTHLFHCSSLQESVHPETIGRASARSRTYHDINASSTAMLDFLNEYRLLEEICVQARIGADASDSGELKHLTTLYITYSTSCNPHYTFHNM